MLEPAPLAPLPTRRSYRNDMLPHQREQNDNGYGGSRGKRHDDAPVDVGGADIVGQAHASRSSCSHC